MRIVLAGGTGFIGNALRENLIQKGNEVVILTRQSAREHQPGVRTRYRHWDSREGGLWESEISGVDAVINLAGEPIVGKRWTAEQKQKIVESRAAATQSLVHAIKKASRKPFLLLNASAVGFYGGHGDETLSEDSPSGSDFLAETCKAWEAHAARAEDFGLRVVRVRIGIVLGKTGGALQKMLPPFRLGIGGPLGKGTQWMSWIHLEDLVNLIHFILEKKEIRGPVNGTAPNPVTMKEFAETLGRVLKKPAVFPAPEFAVKLILGEMSDVLLKGQRVLPKRALSAGFSFKFPALEEALREILEK